VFIPLFWGFLGLSRFAWPERFVEHLRVVRFCKEEDIYLSASCVYHLSHSSLALVLPVHAARPKFVWTSICSSISTLYSRLKDFLLGSARTPLSLYQTSLCMQIGTTRRDEGWDCEVLRDGHNSSLSHLPFSLNLRIVFERCGWIWSSSIGRADDGRMVINCEILDTECAQANKKLQLVIIMRFVKTVTISLR